MDRLPARARSLLAVSGLRSQLALGHHYPLPLELVPALIDRNPGEPRPEPALAAKGADAPPRLDEGVLHGAVGLVPIPEEPMGEAGEGSLVHLDQPPESCLIPPAGRLDELIRCFACLPGRRTGSSAILNPRAFQE